MIAKRIVNLIVSDDAAKQCARDPQCHRLDGHDGNCKTLAVVLVEKAKTAVRGFFERVARVA